MKSKRTIAAIALTFVFAFAVPTIASAQTSDPGIVARKLGSPDPRDSARQKQLSPQVVATTFATSAQEHGAAGYGNVQMGSDKLRQASVVASGLGSPDTKDAAQLARPASTSRGGFDWGDFGIGVALGIGIAAVVVGSLILTASVVGGRRVRPV